ncbi:hypothetical protein ACFLS9_03640 [Bacteroidota bacterium]
MLSANEFNDLCTTCNYIALCTRRKNIIRPILFCEEFNDIIPIKKKNMGNPTENPATINNSTASTVQIKGICSNCENRETCLLPKHEEGIWHCEEYL